MLTILLKVLSILGILLLIVLGITLILILLVLFLPVTYRFRGCRRPLAAFSEEGGTPEKPGMSGWLKINWFFGLLRIRFVYPKPGRLTVKILCFSLAEFPEKEKTKPSKDGKQTKKASQSSGKTDQETGNEADEEAEADRGIQSEGGPEPALAQKISFIDKIECTIQRICDRIKKVCDEAEYYRELLLCEDTKGLTAHAFRRLGKILRSLRPGKLKADILFGTGSPDTTGYALGLYGILSPRLGRKVNITPDFDRAVLEGEIYASGHITVFCLLRQGVMILLDRRLRQLYRKVKAGRKTAEKR